MGFGDTDLVDDCDEGGEGCKAALPSAVSCSICLEAVTDNGDRSWAKLQCGHQFHLDCIGSAFNIKGAMQCPNCRKIEKGKWLYANGCRLLPEFNMDDWAHDEDLYGLSYSEMSFGVQWCPVSGLTRFPSSFDEGEFSSNAYQDHPGQHAIFAEHTALSSATHPCPYIAYIGPVHPPSTSSGSVSDGSNFNNHWSGPSAQNDIPGSYVFPSMDAHYQNWELHSSSFGTGSRIGGADQPLIPSVTQRTLRTSSDIPRPGSFMHPFIVGHSSASRVPSSVTSSMVPPYSGSIARPHDRVQSYFQQAGSNPAGRTPLVSSTRRYYSSHRGSAQVAPMASSSDQSGNLLPASSGRTYQEAENLLPNRSHAWEREHWPSFPLSQAEREIWGPYHPAPGGSDTSIRSSSFRPRHGSERIAPSQNRS
ncbi:E3 ubiquitin- ligase RFI2-like isoform X1 [Olea europaea subsp. europaea]|uniref:E3 ubiquitin- ligase RFI2-like isoform X1 n=1 Tax=Olea europaea subsp. europaea TaxID=158383 RepID=A0A8S0T991_OLEEU|nr:E3 ubiquitin- ligase RFI2-like isoform X1 [Olea europaea subsp. europaea]